MKFIKIIAFILAALWLIGFLLPSKVHVERSMNSKAKPAAIFSLINDLKAWKQWDPWSKRDPAMKVTWGATTAGQGASYSWESTHDQVGSGSLEITESKTNERVATKMNFGKNGNASGAFDIKADGDGSKISWSMDSDNAELPFYFRPIANYFNLMMDKMVGSDFEAGLKSLSEEAEKIPDAPVGRIESVEVTNVEDMHIVQVEGKCAVKDIGKTLGEMYARIGEKMTANKVEPSGMPMAMYPGFNPNDTMTNIIAMIPGKTLCTAKCDADMKCYTMKAQKVIKAIYFGPYENNTLAHDAIQKMMQEKGLQANGDPWEEYANDPMEVKDPALFQTNVYWPVK